MLGWAAARAGAHYRGIVNRCLGETAKVSLSSPSLAEDEPSFHPICGTLDIVRNPDEPGPFEESRELASES